MSDARKPLTIPAMQAMKARGEKIATLTAYDAAFARLMDEAGVDLVLVGDSLGMVVQGHPTTLPVQLEQMVYHASCVRRGLQRAVLAVDLPFMTYATPKDALDAAARLVREAGVQMVKLEGGRHRLDVIRALAREDIPVCAHLGLLPQSVHRLGGYVVQGRDDRSAQLMLEDAMQVEAAGASLLVLECVPALLASEITAALSIPTIGIGAGAGCDGQVLVSYDMLGMTPRCPRFCRDFLADADSVATAFAAYVTAVRQGAFPAPEHAF
jgi:3-methyl-2-oxobutanoate hydroxymethyltransferase